MKKNIHLVILATCLLGSSVSSNGTTLVLDDGWVTFSFGGTGSAVTPDFDFSLLSPAYLNITDAYSNGDVFNFTINGIPQGETSTPNLAADGESDPDAAFSSGDYSRGSYLLGAGNYSVTGVVTDSPFGRGGAFIQLSSSGISPIPEPSNGIIVGAICFFGLTFRRR